MPKKKEGKKREVLGQRLTEIVLLLPVLQRMFTAQNVSVKKKRSDSGTETRRYVLTTYVL